MRAILTISVLVASLSAATALTASSARAEGPISGALMPAAPAGDGGMRVPAAPKGFAKSEDKGGMKAARAPRGGKLLDRGALVGAGLGLLNADFGYGYMEDATTHYSETCFYVFGCKISAVQDPDMPPAKPKIEIRKKAPRPGKPVKDPRTGWTFYPQTDRNTGQAYVQIEDANGNDVHINGEIVVPGDPTQTLVPVR
jgi:hypothetical protein